MSANVNTFGWDTVFAASFPVVNNAITTQRSFPSTFNFTDPAGVTIQGVWQSWQLAAGGSGGNLQMQCMVASGTVSGLGQPAGDLSGSSLIIQVNLQKVADAGAAFTDPTAQSGTGAANKLVVRNTPNGNDPAVSVLQSSAFPNVGSTLFQDMLGSVFGHYFNGAIGSFTQVFSVLMLNEQADTGGFSWLKPTDFSYAVGSTVDNSLANSVFGVLCMVDGATVSGTQQQAVDVNALQGLPTGANSAFVISPEKMTQHMLLNGAITTIQGSSASDFTVGPDGVSIVNANTLTWGNFQTDNGTISPTINAGDFSMRIQDDSILLEIVNATYSPSWGITVAMNLTQTFTYSTVQRSNDGKFVFIPDTSTFGSPHLTCTVNVSKGLQIVQLIGAIVGAIAGLAVGASAIGSFLAAGAEVAVAEASATVEIGADAVVEAAENAGADVVEAAENDAAAGADAGVAAAGNAGLVQQGSFLLSTQFRVYCGIAAALAGSPAVGITVAKYIVASQYEDVPAFDDFAANCTGAVQWPSTNNTQLLGASLRNSLVIAMQLS